MLSIWALYFWVMTRLRSFAVGPVEKEEVSQAVEGKVPHFLWAPKDRVPRLDWGLSCSQ